MKNLFGWLLRRFLSAFAVLVAVQLAVFILGLNLILSGYETSRYEQYETAAAEILEEPEKAASLELPGTNPFFVFSADKQLIFSNKGKGRSLSLENINPVYADGAVTGYFHAGELGFADNHANRVFLISIIILTIVSVVLSAAIGFISAWLSSGKIAAPVDVLRRDIHEMRSLKEITGKTFDIAELTDMSADVAEASLELRSQEEYKRRWLRDLSHDLRTPLSGLKSQLEAMADGVLEPTPERFSRHLYEIERLEALAESIGELTAIESRAGIEKTAVNAAQFISRLVSPFEVELEQKGITLDTKIDADTVYADEQLLLRAAGNVLANAVKYIGDGDCIKVSVAEGRIEIANNGPAISEKQRELIFTRLYRGESSRSTPGSGLGLSITREIINLHGGRISVEPYEQDGGNERGVRFVMTLLRS